MRRSALAVSIAIAGLAALAVPGSALARFRGNLCSVVTSGEVAAVHISAPCHKLRPVTATAHSPLGTVTNTQYESTWGGGGSLGRTHYLVIHIGTVSGSRGIVSFELKRFRTQIIRNGAPVGVGSVSSEHGDTASCENPPSGDCTTATLEAIVKKKYVLTIVLEDLPTTGGEEQSPADEAEDLAQEEADKGPLVAIAKTVAKAL